MKYYLAFLIFLLSCSHEQMREPASNLEEDITLKQELLSKGYSVPSCFQEILSTINDHERKVLLVQPETFLGMINCEEPGFALEVALHEAVHLIDLSMDKKAIESFDPTKKVPGFSLFLFDSEEKISVPYLKMPKPKELIIKRIEKYYPTALSNESYKSYFEDYMTDETMLTANSFGYGLATELNAYTHGLTVEIRTRQAVEGRRFLAQRLGIIFFVGMYKGYLHQLKEDYPTVYLDLLKNESIKKSLTGLFKSANNALKIADYSTSDISEEKGFIKAYFLLGSNEIFKGLIEDDEIKKIEDNFMLLDSK